MYIYKIPEQPKPDEIPHVDHLEFEDFTPHPNGPNPTETRNAYLGKTRYKF